MKTEQRYVISTRNGKVYAIEFEEGWIPRRMLGPFAGEELKTEPADLPWQDAAVALWNAATLVNLCPAERDLRIAGTVDDGGKRSIGMKDKNRREMPGRPVTANPTLAKARRAAGLPADFTTELTSDADAVISAL